MGRWRTERVAGLKTGAYKGIRAGLRRGPLFLTNVQRRKNYSTGSLQFSSVSFTLCKNW